MKNNLNELKQKYEEIRKIIENLEKEQKQDNNEIEEIREKISKFVGVYKDGIGIIGNKKILKIINNGELFVKNIYRDDFVNSKPQIKITTLDKLELGDCFLLYEGLDYLETYYFKVIVEIGEDSVFIQYMNNIDLVDNNEYSVDNRKVIKIIMREK